MRRWIAIATLVVGCGEADDAPAPVAPPEPVTVPSGMPMTETIRIEAEREEGIFRVDDDALLQAALLALSGELPPERTATGRLRVQAAPPGSILARAGLRAADEIVTVAGESTGDDDALLHAYQTVQEQRRFVLVVDRNGERIRLTYEMRGRSRARPPGRGRRPRADGPPAVTGSSASRAPRSRTAPLPPSAVKEVGDGHYEVSRKAFEALLADSRALSRGARIIPAKRDGETIGVKLYGMRSSSWLRLLGFENGDLVRTINGQPLTDPATLLDTYPRLRAASSIRIELERRGAPRVHVYDLTP